MPEIITIDADEGVPSPLNVLHGERPGVYIMSPQGRAYLATELAQKPESQVTTFRLRRIGTSRGNPCLFYEEVRAVSCA